MASGSRIETARRRASVVKRVLAAGAVAAFVAAGFAARAAHPGQTVSRSGSSGSRSTSSSATAIGDDQSRSSDDFSISPSTGRPQAQTSVS